MPGNAFTRPEQQKGLAPTRSFAARAANCTPETSGDTSTARPQHRQILGLDLIRAAAAVMVMFFHLGYWDWTRASDPRAVIPGALKPLSPMLSAGWVGVEIFFVLSGFVIAYSAQGSSPWRFARHRFLRLFPTALLCATVMGAVLLTAYPLHQVALQWTRSVTFFPVGPWIDGTYWTLPIEVAFYALVGLVLAVRNGRFLPGVLAVLGGVSAAVCLLLLLGVPGTGGLVGSLQRAGLEFPPGACLLLVHGCFFALGGLLYLLLLEGSSRLRLFALAWSLVGCMAELLHHGQSMVLASGQSRAIELPLLLWGCAVLGLVAAVRWNVTLGAWVGVRGARLTRQLGIATYPLYLLHNRIGLGILGVTHRRIGYGAALPLTALLLLGLSFFVAQVCEPPLRRGLQRLVTSP